MRRLHKGRSQIFVRNSAVDLLLQMPLGHLQAALHQSHLTRRRPGGTPKACLYIPAGMGEPRDPTCRTRGRKNAGNGWRQRR